MFINRQGSLKKRTVEMIQTYVQRDKRLPVLLDRMRTSGAFVFLLTNSEYWYTKEVMTYLLDFPDDVSLPLLFYYVNLPTLTVKDTENQ